MKQETQLKSDCYAGFWRKFPASRPTLFKSYNDSFGHPAGDEVLRKLAEIIQRAVRTYDFLARYGGEEFVIIMPGTSHDGALVVAERVRRSVQAASWPNRQCRCGAD
ncbi:GGDEF domain-containing protein [Permianibacter aggregans]|nr:GGDEF domain-containing protein [Permianibacter aggregans]